MKLEKAKKVYDIIIKYMKSRFTGRISFDVHMKDGGVTDIHKKTEERLE
jgi:hypothetical protein